ncbi:hypothetical protein Pcinc_002482 [Petrolisthes cinctipes]|uniref:THAP-type domain-containing protein n=1 Tax=Petrolisthes cinctipes TaxID=88211 RepID=A0AAE1L259_PETCI|nr:hypothetical protein Pcinc_002482 [Petrolisthes cinctipes]
MSGRGRPPKRKLDEQQGERKGSKEARLESITVEVREAATLTLTTLTPLHYTHEAEVEEVQVDEVVEVDGRWSKGVMWRTPADSTTQMTLGCTLHPSTSHDQTDSQTQTYHFTTSELPTTTTTTTTTKAVIPTPATAAATPSSPAPADSVANISLESIKVEMVEAGQDTLSQPLRCCVFGCDARTASIDPNTNPTNTNTNTNPTNTNPNVIFYALPNSLGEREAWQASLDIRPSDVRTNSNSTNSEQQQQQQQQHVCSKHFITPNNNNNNNNNNSSTTTTTTTTTTTPIKTKTRKKKTCDMLIAEEAEKIRQGLSTSRPKRRHKPNKNYNWAEIVPLIKAEPDDEYDAEEHPPNPPTPTRTQRRKQHPSSYSITNTNPRYTITNTNTNTITNTTVKQEEKENTAPTSNSVTNTAAANSVTNSLAPPTTKSEDGTRRRNSELSEDSEDELEGSEDEYGPDVSLPTHPPAAPPPNPRGDPIGYETTVARL